MERKDARVDTEEGVRTQHFHVPILEVEGAVGGYDSGAGGRLVIRSICNGEVGQSGNADGRGLGDGGFGGCFGLRGGDRFERRALRDLRFGVYVWQSQRCGYGSCNGIFLDCTNLL